LINTPEIGNIQNYEYISKSSQDMKRNERISECGTSMWVGTVSDFYD